MCCDKYAVLLVLMTLVCASLAEDRRGWVSQDTFSNHFERIYTDSRQWCGTLFDLNEVGALRTCIRDSYNRAPAVAFGERDGCGVFKRVQHCFQKHDCWNHKTQGLMQSEEWGTRPSAPTAELCPKQVCTVTPVAQSHIWQDQSDKFCVYSVFNNPTKIKELCDRAQGTGTLNDDALYMTSKCVEQRVKLAGFQGGSEFQAEDYCEAVQGHVDCLSAVGCWSSDAERYLKSSRLWAVTVEGLTTGWERNRACSGINWRYDTQIQSPSLPQHDPEPEQGPIMPIPGAWEFGGEGDGGEENDESDDKDGEVERGGDVSVRPCPGSKKLCNKREDCKWKRKECVAKTTPISSEGSANDERDPPKCQGLKPSKCKKAAKNGTCVFKKKEALQGKRGQ